jgi:hypothetical protein
MSNKISVAIKLIFIFLTIFTLLFTPLQVAAALGISGVNPAVISNQQSNTITINGTDFIIGSVASLDGYGALGTSYFSNTTLMANVPAGIPVGVYTLTITNPDSSTASLDGALTVVGQVPTAAITPTQEPPNGYERPVLVVNTYSISQETISPGDHFTLFLTLYNAGQHYARNVLVTFTPGDLIPRETGGVVAVGEIAPGNHLDFGQPFILSSDVWSYVASLSMLVSYTDEAGVLYNETFSLSLPVYHIYSSSATATPTPTVTPTTSVKPQLVITDYGTDVTPLQPGNQFHLTITIKNMGASAAKRVTMIVGGGSDVSGGEGGTQQPGGISGSGGEFTNFAPIGASNVQSLGEIPVGVTLTASQPLIVNTSTAPGAYPLKISFVYADEQNRSFIDDQVITLLVYRLPILDINFYQELQPLFTGQINMLPLQVVNLGRNSVVLGNMRVNASTGQFSNQSILVGTLESGGYFTLDASYMPEISGPVELVITVDYTNDFNQSHVITKTVTVEVFEQPIIEPPIDEGTNGGEQIPDQPESLMQKIWRFILGLIGLDSGIRTAQPSNGEIPVEPIAPEGEPIIVPVKPLKGP